MEAEEVEASPVLVQLAAPLLVAALLEEEASVHPQLFLRQSLGSEERWLLPSDLLQL